MFDHVSAGQPLRIPWQDYNGAMDAAKWHRQTRGGIEAPRSVEDPSDSGLVLVENTTGRRLGPYSILGLSSPISPPNYGSQSLTSFLYMPSLQGVEPTSDHTGKFCVIQRHAEPGEVVPAMVSGITPCLLKVESTDSYVADVETDTEDDDGQAIDPTRYLKVGASGSAQVLSSPTETGEQWGYVRLGNKPTGTWKTGLVTTLDPNLFTPGSSGSNQEFEFTTISPTSGVPFELDTDGYLHFTEAVDPCFFFIEIFMSIPYVQNNWCSIETRMQGYNPQTGNWSTTGGYCNLNAAWPNVAVLGSTGGNTTLNQLIMRGSSVVKDAKFRIRSTITYSGSAPQVRVNCSAFRIFYQ